MKQVIAIVVLLCAFAYAIPPESFSDSQLVDLVEVDVEKRSVDRRKFQLNLFGDNVILNLERSKGFLPETLMVHFLNVDENGERVVTDWSHRTGGAKDLFFDREAKASILLDELDGRTKVHGNIMGQYVIEPLEGNEFQPNEMIVPSAPTTVKHKLYKTNVTQVYKPVNDFIEHAVSQQENYDDETVEKRAVSKIYPHIHAVVDYSHYRKLGVNKNDILNYIRILYHTAQVAHFDTMQGPACQISLQGITVCESDAACAELNKGKWSYGEYKYPFDNIGKYAYQERYRTGTDYDMMFVTTSNKICPKPGDCGVGGFGNMPGVCSAFRDYDKSTNRVGIMIDHGAYDAVRGLGHEIGHMLNMPHDDKNSCFGQNYIMWQGQYSPNNWRYSSCSMASLNSFLNKRDSDCIKTPPNGNQIGGWDKTYLAGRYKGLDEQCRAIYGSNYKSCVGTWSRQDSVCQHLQCNTGGPGRGGCAQYHLAAVAGSTCGPNLWCMRGYCVPFPG